MLRMNDYKPEQDTYVKMYDGRINVFRFHFYEPEKIPCTPQYTSNKGFTLSESTVKALPEPNSIDRLVEMLEQLFEI